MEKSRFRILGLRCLKMSPEDRGFGNTDYHVRAMQKALYEHEGWIMFYQHVKAIEVENTICIDNALFDDECIFGNSNVYVGVCAIVGKNGSGKSSIMDLMIRILNNAAASLVGEDQLYSAAEHLHYIENVYGAILYLQGDELHQLVVKGREVYITDYEKSKEGKYTSYIEIQEKLFLLKREDCRPDALLPLKSRSLSELASLFYTIVINYSLYSYYYNDCHQEATNEAKLKKLRRKPDLVQSPFEQFWMTGLFHKNDGYQTPVVINPMRVGGRINAPQENKLAKERLLSLLFVEAKDGQNKKGVYRYPFRTINGNLRIMALAIPMLHDAHKRWSREWMVERELFGNRSKLYKDYDQYSAFIIEWFTEYYGIDNTVKGYAYATRYLVYKIFKIGLTYLNYNCIISNLRHRDFSLDLLYKHLQRLVEDDTHITVKLRRTLLYLIYGNDIYGEPQDESHKSVFELNTIEDRIIVARNEFNSMSPPFFAQLDDFLPPPIFDIEFRIVKNDSDEWDEVYTDRDIIPFNGLSSGERQIAYTTSNFAYHLINVNSVWKSKAEKVGKAPLLKYKYINAIFDEIELYYHPELQRRFLSLLLNMLRDINLENIAGINILLVTHSPFVLSDLPRTNVLALGGDSSMDETFCANIHEMLNQSFFLQYTMGEVAQHCVESLFHTYREFSKSDDKDMFANSIPDSDIKRLSYIADTIADEYLRKTAKRMLEELKFYRKEVITAELIERKIQEANEEIAKLQGLRKQFEHD